MCSGRAPHHRDGSEGRREAHLHRNGRVEEREDRASDADLAALQVVARDAPAVARHPVSSAHPSSSAHPISSASSSRHAHAWAEAAVKVVEAAVEAGQRRKRRRRRTRKRRRRRRRHRRRRERRRRRRRRRAPALGDEEQAEEHHGLLEDGHNRPEGRVHEGEDRLPRARELQRQTRARLSVYGSVAAALTCVRLQVAGGARQWQRQRRRQRRRRQQQQQRHVSTARVRS